MIIVVIPIFEKRIKRFDRVENFRKSIYFLKFFIIESEVIKFQLNFFKHNLMFQILISISEIRCPTISPELIFLIPNPSADSELEADFKNFVWQYYYIFYFYLID